MYIIQQYDDNIIYSFFHVSLKASFIKWNDNGRHLFIKEYLARIVINNTFRNENFTKDYNKKRKWKFCSSLTKTKENYLENDAY